jgi:hypothetical protein
MALLAMLGFGLSGLTYLLIGSQGGAISAAVGIQTAQPSLVAYPPPSDGTPVPTLVWFVPTAAPGATAEPPGIVVTSSGPLPTFTSPVQGRPGDRSGWLTVALESGSVSVSYPASSHVTSGRPTEANGGQAIGFLLRDPGVSANATVDIFELMNPQRLPLGQFVVWQWGDSEGKNIQGAMESAKTITLDGREGLFMAWPQASMPYVILVPLEDRVIWMYLPDTAVYVKWPVPLNDVTVATWWDIVNSIRFSGLSEVK